MFGNVGDSQVLENYGFFQN